MNNKYDVIILGAGAAGMAAGIYTARRKLKTLILGKNTGGQMIWARDIENYPGYKFIKGFELINKMREQVEYSGADIKTAEARKISQQKEIFTITTSEEQYQTKGVIIALGMMPRQLNIPGEKEFVGKGVSYCANCDAPLYKNKTVAVVGGGNAAMDAAEVLSKIAKQVLLIHRTEHFRGFETLIQKVTSQKNIQILYNSEVKKISGAKTVEAIQVVNNKTAAAKDPKVNGVFIEVGHEANTELVADLVALDKKNQIIVDENCQTNLAGMFAAGDVTQTEHKQIVVACAQGAIAALSLYKYLQTKS